MRVRSLQRPLRLVWRETDDHLITVHAAAHVAVQQKGYPAEHLLLRKAFAFAEVLTDSSRQLFVERHALLSGEGAELQHGVPVPAGASGMNVLLDYCVRQPGAADPIAVDNVEVFAHR